MKLVLNSEENKINLLKTAKKPEGETGRRVVKSVHTSGLDAEAEGGEETIGSRTKGKESQRRKGLDNIPRENCKEEKLLSKSDDLVCFLPCDAVRCTVFVIVILSVLLSVCPSLRLSVTLVHCVHMVRPTITMSSSYGSPIILVSGDITFIPKFEGGHPERGR